MAQKDFPMFDDNKNSVRVTEAEAAAQLVRMREEHAQQSQATRYRRTGCHWWRWRLYHWWPERGDEQQVRGCLHCEPRPAHHAD